MKKCPYCNQAIPKEHELANMPEINIPGDPRPERIRKQDLREQLGIKSQPDETKRP